MNDFERRRAAVTGAAGGIGRAVVELLLERGASVVAADLSAELPGGAEPVVTDVATQAGRAALVEATGPCDHLVIAHGIVRPRPIADTLEEDWDAILAVNAKAPYFICRDFGALLRDGGSVVTVSSVSARSASSLEQSVYCASKAALSSITRSFAHAYAPRGIRVNAILPGIVDTPMQEQFLAAAARARRTTPKDLHEARLRMVPLGRTSSPGECAEMVLWLLGPAAGYLTGQQIAADGGLTMY
jgi:NAD(P)-dependent dehydrogenase (short-subunit alcohol dehydrogenase family)